jgi:hypothetical protein
MRMQKNASLPPERLGNRQASFERGFENLVNSEFGTPMTSIHEKP